MPKPPDILQDILAHKAEEVEARKAVLALDKIKRRALEAPPPRNFARAIEQRIAQGKLAVIAELKRISPSRGVIRGDYQPAAIARAYERAGATCLSVLTDERYFQGADAHLIEVRAVSTLPVLRKDFMVDPYQIYEARAIGADCILLIVAGLNDAKLCELAELAGELGMDVLVEVHNREELERGLMLRLPLIGINNRDLHTFKTDIQTTLHLLLDMMHDRTVVTESGIHTPNDVALLRRHGVSAFLVGEALMTAADPGERLKELFSG
jgi:indole-3-glycerol phosphate synthase